MTQKQLHKHSQSLIDRILKRMQSSLKPVLADAEKHVRKHIANRLLVDEAGKVTRDARNVALIRQLPRVMDAGLAAAGYYDTVSSSVAAMAGLPTMSEMLKSISAQFKAAPAIQRVKIDETPLRELQALTTAEHEALVEHVMAQTRSHTMRQLGGAASLPDLTADLIDGFGRLATEAVGLAETASAMYQRTVTAESAKRIERDLPQGSIKYMYEGPKDKLTRPFCLRMLEHAPMTREQIEKLDNGQLPNPFVTGGGYRCRHQWVVEEINVVN